jgi:hypothetical protein
MHGKQSLSPALAVLLITGAVAQAAPICELVANATQTDIVDLSKHATVQIVESRVRAPLLNLGYIVPRSAFPTGAFVAKIRHQVIVTDRASAASAAGPTMIKLDRAQYESPCSPTHEIKQAYSHPVEAERYVDYHFYNLRDAEPDPQKNLENFHADVGMRPTQSYFTLSKTSCFNTHDESVRYQFLYGDNIRTATVFEKASRQAALFSTPFGTSPTYAAPAGYREYTNIQTIIIPYKKSSTDRDACFGLFVAIPPHAASTEISIFDADQALQTPLNAQRKWTITWTDPPIATRVSRRR